MLSNIHFFMSPCRPKAGVPPIASVILLAAAIAFSSNGVAQTQNGTSPITALKALSLEDLTNVEVTSVSKAPESLSGAPAAIYVITRDDILRAGARTIPDMLRLAPNLQVAQITASSFAITARGFNGTAASKLLVLIDGRSVYTPYHSGVDWGVQIVPPEDIERIEVISGPGAALWGANAVNGVINIITRKASETQGGSLNVGGGNLEDRGTLHYGGELGKDFSYRAYVDSYRHGDDVTATGTNAQDGWRQTQGGFRTDYAPAGLTVQGDFYQGSENQLSAPNAATWGDNVLARWDHELPGGSSLQVQTYYDYVAFSIPGAASDYLNTYDLDIQHSFSWGTRQNIVWGGGYRLQQDNFPIVLSSTLSAAYFSPANRTLSLGNVFFQDSIAVTDTLKLVLGAKLEDDTYSGLQPLPNVRLAWNITNSTTAWAAISRAVREPSRIDRDLNDEVGGFLVIKGGNFQPEKLTAYEIGYRAQILPNVSISISTFYNVYTDLRSVEPAAPGSVYPIEFANLMSGDTDGVEIWANYSVNAWWRLSAGANWLHEKLHFDPGSADLTSTAIAGDDPSYQASLRSTMDLARHWALNLDLRRIGALPDPTSPAYTELDAHLGWKPLPTLEFSLTGSNLIHPQHLEFGTMSAPLQLGASGVETRRSAFANIRWSF